MTEYDVVISATVCKTIRVEADDEESAAETAHELFSVLNDCYPEDYQQDTVEVQLVTEQE